MLAAASDERDVMHTSSSLTEEAAKCRLWLRAS